MFWWFAIAGWLDVELLDWMLVVLGSGSFAGCIHEFAALVCLLVGISSGCLLRCLRGVCVLCSLVGA